MAETFTALTAAGLPVTVACRLVGRPRASHYRHVRPPLHGPRRRRRPAAGADRAEQAAVLELINSAGYADLSIGQMWAGSWTPAATVLDVEHVPDRPRGRADPGTTPAGHASAAGETGTGRRWPVASVVVGYHEAPRTGQGSLVPPVRADRHLLPLQPRMARRRGRGFRAGKGFHRRGDQPQRVGAAHRARRPGHLDDLQTGVGVARRPGGHTYSFPTAGVQRQPVLRGAVQDPEVPARLPRLLRQPARSPRTSWTGSSPSTTTCTGTPASAGTPRRRCTSAPTPRSTTPGRPPWTPPGPRTPNASPAGPDHPGSPTRAGSTSPDQNYRRPDLNLSHLT